MAINTDAAAIDLANAGALKEVHVDALALLKIVKHCHTTFPAAVTGQLLGMASEGTLQITNSFPLPSLEGEDAQARGRANSRYVQDMLRNLREVNVDANVVGWYQSAYLGSFVTKELVDTQVQFQQGMEERSVVLVHDVSRSTQGSLSLKAFRVSQTFVDAYREGKFTNEALARHGVSHTNMFEELPIVIHNSHLVTSFLHNLPHQPSYDNMDLSVEPFLEKSMEYLLDSVDDYTYELGNIGYWQRQVGREQAKIQGWIAKNKQENALRQASGQAPLPEDEWTRLFKIPPEPSKLDSLLAAGQIGQYCDQIDSHAAPVSSKMFAVRHGMSIE